MREVSSVKAIKDVGLEGDRYALGKGTFSRTKEAVVASLRGSPTPRHATFVGIEAIAEANQTLITPFTPEETRRNILTEGIDLNSLVGQAFAIGEARFWGFEPCDPCNHPNKLSGKIGFTQAFDTRGGLRAAIMSDGFITVGDEIKSLIIHALHSGQAICGFNHPLLPKDWPEGHLWMGIHEAKYVTCPNCKGTALAYLVRQLAQRS